jgi:hypothetical protein
VSFAEGASPDTRNYRVSCDKAREVLGFETTWTARKGAEELAAAYRQVGLTLAEFEGPRYQRLAHLRQLMAEGAVDTTLRFTGT